MRLTATRFRHRLLSLLCVAAIVLHTPALAAGAVDSRAAKGAQSGPFRQSGDVDHPPVGRDVLVGGASELAFSGLLKLIGPGVGRVGAGSTRLIGHHSDDSLEALDDIARHADQADNTLGTACRTNSFIPSTLVLMADGSTKPIEDVQVGDLVEATDPETGEQGPRLVTDLIVGDGLKHLVDIDIDGETITATDRHPFWVDDEGRWVDAENLETGDRLLGADGTTVAVDRVSRRTEARRVHNLTVDGIHTYHVLAGEQPVLVHNCRTTTNSGSRFSVDSAGVVTDATVPSSSQAAEMVRNATPVGSGLKTDAMHAASSFDIGDIASNGTVFRTVGGDGVTRTLIQVPEVGGRYEWIVDDAGNLTHARFVPNGTINGVPNRP